jgi:short-subunit dehydrogenase
MPRRYACFPADSPRQPRFHSPGGTFGSGADWRDVTSDEDTHMLDSTKPLAVVTGASTGIGLELARQCAANGFNLVVVADEPAIRTAADELRKSGVAVEAVEADLATTEGVDKLVDKIDGRSVDALLANAGRGLAKAFLDQDWKDIRFVIDTNVTGTVELIHRIGRDMRARGKGKILITGSVAGFMPGAYHAVYNASKSFLDSFAQALRAELKDSGVTVTCLMPAETETAFFERAGLEDTKLGQSKKADPADVAKAGFKAMMDGDGQVVPGWHAKLEVLLANIMPAGVTAKQHAKMAAPGTADS